MTLCYECPRSLRCSIARWSLAPQNQVSFRSNAVGVLTEVLVQDGSDIATARQVAEHPPLSLGRGSAGDSKFVGIQRAEEDGTGLP